MTGNDPADFEGRFQALVDQATQAGLERTEARAAASAIWDTAAMRRS